MKLFSFLKKEFIKIDCEINSKKDAMSFLVNLISNDFSYKKIKNVLSKNILENKSVEEITYNTGVVISHAELNDIKDFNDLLIAVCMPKKSFIDNGVEIKLVVLIIASGISKNVYSSILSSFERISQDQDFIKKLLNLKNINDLLNVLSNVKVKNEIAAEDIMSTDINKISPEQSVEAIIDLFYKNNFSYAPVVDNNDNIIGEITMFDILKVGMSDYALTIGNIGFLSTLNPMYESLKDKDNIKIKDIMQKVNIFVEKDSSITEISLKMIHNTKRQIPVIEDKKIVGIISYMDILKKIIRS